MTHARIICLAAALAAVACPAAAQAPKVLRAFPGAEGFGSVAAGGRGGRVIKVTNLKTRGPGSLQAACQATGPRIVVFDVSGVIPGPVTITSGKLTIAGQTAPGAGVTIEGILATRYRIQPPCNDIIIRFLRVRPRPLRRKAATGDCLQITNVNRLIIDHVSCSWGSDENVDLCGSSSVTVQWCAIEESDPRGHVKGQHNYGMIVGYTDRGDVTLHHNLFAHHQKRAPLIGCDVVDHRNNVIYNMLLPFIFHPTGMNRRNPGRPFRFNLVANTFQSGPNVHAHMKGRPFDKLIWNRPNTHLYAAGNTCSWLDGPQPPPTTKKSTKPPSGRRSLSSEAAWPAPPVKTQTAKASYDLVLAQAGCLPRDAVSKRTIKEVRAGSGSWGRHEPAGGLLAGLTPAKGPKDTDADGIPDTWERAHNLNPADPTDAAREVPAGASPKDRHKGYTWIEYYVNDLADKLIATGATFKRSEA